MVAQFARSGTKGPTNYYRTYDMNREAVRKLGTGVNITAPTLYVSRRRPANPSDKRR